MKKIVFILAVVIFYGCQTNANPIIEPSTQSATISNETHTTNASNKVAEAKKEETNCDGNKRAYEFGREMSTMVKLGSSSLQSAINEFAEPLGIEPPFNSTNPCVIKGFEDEYKGIPSPFNKDGKNWTNF